MYVYTKFQTILFNTWKFKHSVLLYYTIVVVFERAYNKLSNVIQFNYSECDTDMETLAKSQKYIRAKELTKVLRLNYKIAHLKWKAKYIIYYQL